MTPLTSTFFSGCIYLLVAFGLAYLELAWLYKSFNVAGLWGSLIIIGFINFIYVYYFGLVINTYLSFLYYIFPVIPFIYILIKAGVYHLVKGFNHLPLNTPLLLNILSVFLYVVVAAYLAWFIKDINPTVVNTSKAIEEKNHTALKTMLWLTPFKEKFYMPRLVNEAIFYDNTEAIQILIRHGADPREKYQIENVKSVKARDILIKWQMDHDFFLEEHDVSFDENNYREYFEEYCLSSSVPALQHSISKGFRPKDVSDVIHKTISLYPFKNTKASPEEINELIEKIDFLHKQGVSLTEIGDIPYFGSPIYTVINSGYELDPFLIYLIERGCPVNERIEDALYSRDGTSKTGTTPLMLAVRHNRASYVKILLSKGADKLVKDGSGKTATEYATDTTVNVAIRLELSKY